MTILCTLDLEWKTTLKDSGKIDGSCYNENNYLVSAGYKIITDKEDGMDAERYLFFNHNELQKINEQIDCKLRLQYVLDQTDLLIGHNIKSDLSWIKACGFVYTGKVWDTMICEYVYARAVKVGYSLEESCKRRKVKLKKSELIQDYKDKGVGFEAIPMDIVEEYGRGDVQSCYELYLAQQELLAKPENAGLLPTILMSNEYLLTLLEIERNGIAIDVDALELVEREYVAERAILQKEIEHITSSVMGDMPINLASPEQLGMVIYSRKVRNKVTWASTFNLGLNDSGKPLRKPYMDKATLRHEILKGTQLLEKQRASQCNECRGTGRVEKFVKSTGALYKTLPKCVPCSGAGICYTGMGTRAGFGLGPRNINDITANGFSTSSDMLEYLAALPATSKVARDFLTKIVRLNAVETYLSTFINGIKRSIRNDGLVHPNFNQCVTYTGRLSSSDPNWFNMPRGNTFPVKKAIVSRWKGGQIAEIDEAQLEFRIAAELSRCPIMIDEIEREVDVHKYTAEVLTDAGQTTSRQDAKPKTFRPLYGGKSGTPAEIEYNKAFMAKYDGLRAWHERLLDQAVSTHLITLPSGRQFKFPAAERMKHGYVVNETNIKNYPVQAFATADLVPLACIELQRKFKEHEVKSVIINTVYDSIICDIHPSELSIIPDMMAEACRIIPLLVKERYGYQMVVPLGIELKMGDNWLSMKEVQRINLIYL